MPEMPDVVSHEQTANVMKITIRGNSPEALTSLPSRNSVIEFARSKSFPARGLKEIPNPYPVDAAGKTDADVIMGKRPVACWQADFEVAAGVA